ncbi:MAG TPA: sugar phosphate nucleotidyltransferase [Nitrospira sp.]|nr:sugar phosphate nucleotidyltransferase [Nitrospira sp.]
MTQRTDPATDGSKPQVVGLVPAAGLAKRLQPFPCSKELFPVGFSHDERSGAPKPKVAMQYLLEKFRAAGIAQTYLVIREGKWDIPRYFQDGAAIGMSLAYVVIPASLGPPDTIDRAYPFVADKRIAFGFPDILFGPPDAYVRLIEQQERTRADIVLGLHPVEHPQLWDMVETDEQGVVRRIVMKPAATTLRYGWDFALWTPVFSEFLHRFMRSEDTAKNLGRLASRENDPGGDVPVGVVLQAALEAGLAVNSVIFAEDRHLDIGTPENLAKAVRLFSST